jgi:hypothetical protein
MWHQFGTIVWAFAYIRISETYSTYKEGLRWCPEKQKIQDKLLHQNTQKRN